MRDQILDAITVSSDRREVTLGWSGGHRQVIGAEALRLACRCAWCTRDRILNQFPPAFANIAVSKAELIGDHALHLGFSDGHARGIFPFPYLDAIANGEAAPFLLSPARAGAKV